MLIIEIPESRTSVLESANVELLSQFSGENGIVSKSVPGGEDGLFYYQLDCNKKEITTSYFIGVDWIVEKKLPIYVRPKLNNGKREINYLGMLFEALQEPDNIAHLDGLVNIEFEKPPIGISQKQDILSVFLIIQFLQVLKIIVKKGLKKSYYLKQENLNSKIKGKIEIGRSVKKNLFRGAITKTVCQYQEYGVDSDENRLLKKAYVVSCKLLNQGHVADELVVLWKIIQYINPALVNISSEISVNRIMGIRTNPIYTEYAQAIRLAKLILKRSAYNISSSSELVVTPPFWIDMSKLFELYVYKKLREQFSGKEVKYHLKARRQELDFILNAQGLLFIIDAKYKPSYYSHGISVEDVRQVSGYARLKRVYKELKIADYNQNIPCLIIYPHQDCQANLPVMSKSKDWLVPEDGYVKLFKLGISLPEINSN